MAEQQQGLLPPEIPDAPFPSPPPLWKHFTTSNQEQLKEKETQVDFEPTELHYSLAILRPPPTPSGAYTVFSTTYTNPPEPTLPQPSELLFDPADLTRSGSSANGRPHVRMLSLLLKSLNLNFLEFFTVMGDDPVSWEQKMKDIGMILENVMAVINLLRPHQARESVKALLEKRLSDGREEMERCDQMKEKIEEFLRKVEEDGKVEKMETETANGLGVNGMQSPAEKRKAEEFEKSKRLWAMLDDLDAD